MASISSKVREALMKAKDLEEVKKILTDCEIEFEEADATHIWEEIERHNKQGEEKLSLDELDAVAGGADRNWIDDGCAATCEEDSWCMSNDYCKLWDVTYDEFHMACPNSPNRHHLYCERIRIKLQLGFKETGALKCKYCDKYIYSKWKDEIHV